VTWAGYVATTGLHTMDAIIADRYHIPVGDEQFYRERVLRLPHGFICYTPPGEAPNVARLPAASNGHVTFGCFGNPAKLSPDVLDAWGRILARVSNSRLLPKYRSVDDPANRSRIVGALERHGIAPERIMLEGLSTRREMLQRYDAVDIALDTFPYCGCVTTLEALWMGVPVVTRPSDRFVGRHSLSILSNIGLTDTIGRSTDDYVEIACRLAGDRDGLSVIRQGLRPRMLASPLMDGPGFTRDLEDLYLQIVARRFEI